MKRTHTDITDYRELLIGDVVHGKHTSIYGVESNFTLEIYGGQRDGTTPQILGRAPVEFFGSSATWVIESVEREFALPETPGTVCWIKTESVLDWTIATLVRDYSLEKWVWRIPEASHRKANGRGSTAAVLPEWVTEFKVVDTGTPIDVVNGAPGPTIDPATNTPLAS